MYNCLRTVNKKAKNLYGADIVKEVFKTQSSNEMNISSGINLFKIPSLYNKYFKYQLDKNLIITDYSMDGNSSLLQCLKVYEKLIASNECKLDSLYANNICVTIGATQAISYLFDYYNENYKEKEIVLIGFNYYLFYKCCEMNKLHFHEIVSQKEDRIAPSIKEIRNSVESLDIKMIVLTIPLNPSGECYTEDEIKEIISLAKKKNAILCIDKCQLDEFANVFRYINIGNIVKESGYTENVIIINSQSKVRSIPGIRSGYIIANQKVIEYIKERREKEIYCPPMMCVTALIIDLILRVYQFGQMTNNSKYNFVRIVRIFKHAIQANGDSKKNKEYFKEILNLERLLYDYCNFKEELEYNWKVVIRNYQFATSILKDDLFSITLLEGGFNFCIKLKKTQNYTQKVFLKNVLGAVGIQLLSEDFFTLQPKLDLSPFWIRISAAQDHNIFSNWILKLKKYIDSI